MTHFLRGMSGCHGLQLILVTFNTLRLRQNGHHFLDDILKCIFLNENVWISITTVRNPLLLCPLVLAQDGGTRSRQKFLHRDFSATVLFWVIMLGEAIFDIKHDF